MYTVDGKLERVGLEWVSPKTFFAHARESNLAPRYGCEHILSTRFNYRTCCPEPLEPHAKRLFASCYSIGQFRNQKRLEFIFCVTTHKRRDQASSRGTRHDPREEIRIQKRLDHPEMICKSCESVTKPMKPGVAVQYPNEAPPERQRAVAPRLVLTLR